MTRWWKRPSGQRNLGGHRKLEVGSRRLEVGSQNAQAQATASSFPSACFAKRWVSRECTGAESANGQPPNSVRR